jgi:hypothetical protein
MNIGNRKVASMVNGGGPTELDRKLGAVSGTLLGSRYAAFC